MSFTAGVVQMPPDSTGKMADADTGTRNAQTVYRLIHRVAGTVAAAIAEVANSAPAGTEYGLLTRQTGPLPTGTNSIGTVRDDNTLQANTVIAATGAAAAAVTLTIPAAGVGIFTYLCWLHVGAYATVATTGGTTPILIPSTGLTAVINIGVPTALAVGVWDRQDFHFAPPLKGSAANTAITFVTPATTSVIYRLTAGYFTQ